MPRDKFRTLDDPDPVPPSVPSEVVTMPPARRKGGKMLALSNVFLLLAVFSFVLAAFNTTPSARVNPTALGLFFWALSQASRLFVP